MEDEWERELESNEDLDLLFVRFDPRQVTIEELQNVITEHEFQSELR